MERNSERTDRNCPLHAKRVSRDKEIIKITSPNFSNESTARGRLSPLVSYKLNASQNGKTIYREGAMAAGHLEREGRQKEGCFGFISQ